MRVTFRKLKRQSITHPELYTAHRDGVKIAGVQSFRQDSPMYFWYGRTTDGEFVNTHDEKKTLDECKAEIKAMADQLEAH